jgi:putative ABC transport system permease protein
VALPLSYNIRNVRIRWQVSLLAVFGIAMVVAAVAVLMSMQAGFERALASTGRPDNVMIVQRGSASELTSAVPIDQRNQIIVDERIARGPDGQPLAAWEWVIVMAQPKLGDGQPTNVSVRAVTPKTFEVRGGVDIVEGRNFTPGLDEIIVGHKIAHRVAGLDIGQTVKFQRKEFKVVGHFAAAGGAFESEVWGDFDTFGAAFQRGSGSNVVVARMKDAGDIKALDNWIRAQPNMQLKAVPERKYYEDQAGNLSKILRILAGLVGMVMGVGAVFGAMNTMYAIVVARTREIGTLRALGFSRRSILFSFVLESVILALIGGVVGCVLALPMNGFSTGTGQTDSFSEIAFAFQITPHIVGLGLGFSLVMGLLGGLLPALRAARLPIISALREA